MSGNFVAQSDPFQTLFDTVRVIQYMLSPGQNAILPDQEAYMEPVNLLGPAHSSGIATINAIQPPLMPSASRTNFIRNEFPQLGTESTFDTPYDVAEDHQASTSSTQPLSSTDTPAPGTPLLPPPHTGHNYQLLDASFQREMYDTIQPCSSIHGKKRFRCTVPNCPPDVRSKAAAQTHARAHLGHPKLYKCSCGASFACVESAIRHCENQVKMFACKFCFKKFARRDYRFKHQKKCMGTPLPTM